LHYSRCFAALLQIMQFNSKITLNIYAIFLHLKEKRGIYFTGFQLFLFNNAFSYIDGNPTVH